MKTKLDKHTKGMVLKMIESVWGNLRSPQARQAWARGQAPRNRVADQVFRHWIISQGIPDDVARMAWENGSRVAAIEFLAEQKDWIEYYGLQKEVREAFKRRTPE